MSNMTLKIKVPKVKHFIPGKRYKGLLHLNGCDEASKHANVHSLDYYDRGHYMRVDYDLKQDVCFTYTLSDIFRRKNK